MVMAAAMVIAGPGSMRARGGAVKWREAYLAKKLSRQKNGGIFWRYRSLPPKGHHESMANGRRPARRWEILLSLESR